ncbi:MAG: hypothetical protein GY760_12560 [Deltaproteobacteria bacterium]|nr:hypothetical protein [Deltaproteobacteria bacterium]
MKKFFFYIGGVINLLLVFLHLMFFKIQNWSETLKCLSEDNRSIMYCLNLHCSVLLILFVYLSFFYNIKLLKSGLGRLLTGFIAFFYLQRAVEDIYFWGIDPAIFSVCVITGLMYTYLCFSKTPE